MLRNYDPLVQELDNLREAVGRLRDNASGDPEEAAAIDGFAAAANRQEELTEQFKSDTALLQREGARNRLRRFRHQADQIRPPARQDRTGAGQ
jgi:hypothetical protein